MSAESLNFWLCKFVQEVRDKDSNKYPEKTLYQVICCVKRHYEENGHAEMNPLNKENFKFQVFRKVLDAEMKDIHLNNGPGYGQKQSNVEREAITAEEEKQMWSAGVLGESSPEILMRTLYFYIGKFFGLRAVEHRMLRLDNFAIGENEITYLENVSKTYHGGLKDLKKNRRSVTHYCHIDDETEHTPCIVKLFTKYMAMVSNLSRRNDAFYFRPSKTSYKFENYPVGIHTLNAILPSLTKAAGLQRKTAHSLRATCASTLFQNNLDEKLIRERTGHISNALFKYEKASKEQELCVSACLAPPAVVQEQDKEPISKCEKDKVENIFNEDVGQTLGNVANEDNFFNDDLDEILASVPFVDGEQTTNREIELRNISLENLFCGSNLSNATVHVNLNLTK